MTWIKICGTTNLDDAQLAVEAGADALGFVFYDKSPRNIDPEKAREIVTELPAYVEKVGVFVDDSFKHIRDVVEQVKLTAVQFYTRTWEHVEDLVSANGNAISPKLIMALPADELSQADVLIQTRILHAIMLDSGSSERPGGTGKTFDWKRAHGVIQGLSLTVPVIVAGGLTPLNVGEAVKFFQPYGVDVASGVEAKPGKKDSRKVQAFVRAVREADKLA
ncbi:MAG: N-(5'-phosphoribosyl)anthranilate isomerase [Acidobacteria bacterium]|nr:MAG: N-(5'-phosphoribosyl)anthranilate isomerase [Acidobacteriota bacterium]